MIVDLYVLLPYINSDKQGKLTMDEIQTLERSINLLISKLETTVIENKALATKMEELIMEKSVLMRKNDQARNRLESMINRLKNLEQTA